MRVWLARAPQCAAIRPAVRLLDSLSLVEHHQAVSGSVAKIEGSFVATLKLHETARGMLLASARATAPTALELIEAIKRSSAELFR
jgi:ethanolamine utilization microcompartment shell protein EutL